MSLPETYTSPTEYFTDSLLFLKEFQWLYNYPNTDILVHNILRKFPTEWRAYFCNCVSNSVDNLNNLPLGKLEDPAPDSLRCFFNRLDKLNPTWHLSTKTNAALSLNSTKMGAKKKHEVLSLAPLINDICSRVDAPLIVDVGSGRGYLSQTLHSLYGYDVLGIEGSSEKVSLAEKYQRDYFTESENSVKYRHHFVTKSSGDAIKDLINTSFDTTPHETSQKCFVGLHACADLTPTILEIFCELETAKALVIMPCCYHRMQVESDDINEQRFKCFPLSTCLQKVYENSEGSTFLRTPFLRLACQTKADAFMKMTAEEHDAHAKAFFFRALLQVVVNEQKCSVSRLKRKTGKLKTTSEDVQRDFVAYLDHLSHTHVLVHDGLAAGKLDINDQRFKEIMMEKWDQYKGEYYMVEVLTAFQAAIQSVCENIVLLDRVAFLKERGMQCYVQKVADEVVSPRCYALVAFKS